jgi:hypothetical protein
MKISGFSFARNASLLHYPVRESIMSILPICNEFVIAVGRGDEGDRTRELVESIGDPRIRTIDTEWCDRSQLGQHVFAQQTNVALEQCTGDWCFYIQSDEAIHERYLPTIRSRCEQLLEHDDVEGLLFRFRHFWGDFDHYVVSHAWYPCEIRIVRNGIGVHSYKDAQSFRIDDRKLRVARVDAEVYHYGWVRPPHLMQRKRREFRAAYAGAEAARIQFEQAPPRFDYGPLNRLPVFDGTPPESMRAWVESLDWQDQLDYRGVSTTRHKHDRAKYRFLSFIEQRILGGRRLGGFRNYVVVR